MRRQIGTDDSPVKLYITDEVYAGNSGRPLLEIENTTTGENAFYRDDDVTPNGMTGAQFKFEIGVK